MGARLAAYYAEAEGLAGLDGKIQLAMLTRIPSTRALVEPDSPDNVSKFEGAMHLLRRGRGSASNHNSQSFPPPGPLFSERVSGTHRSIADGEELFWGVLGSLHDSLVGIFDRDARCLLVWESRSLEQRYPAPDATSTVRDTFARLISEHYAGEIRMVYESRSVFQSELECAIHGREAWLSVSFSAAHDDAGRVLGVHAFIQDITAQKRHEQALRESEKRLREQASVYVELVSQQTAGVDDVEDTLRRITQAAATTLGIARASVWFYDDQKTRLVCADAYDRSRDTHEHGQALEASRYPAYFAAMAETRRALAVDDAIHDPRTACLADAHLIPNAVGALLDVPIWVQGDIVGVVCHEHVGGERTWTADEENFALMMASFVALSLQLDG